MPVQKILVPSLILLAILSVSVRDDLGCGVVTPDIRTR
jgi:hypothetical protein